jgi:hypothetical protein
MSGAIERYLGGFFDSAGHCSTLRRHDATLLCSRDLGGDFAN